MRICLYSATGLPKLGGQELVVDALARQYQRMGHDVTVLVPLPRRPLRPDDGNLPYRVIRHPRFYSTRHFVSWYRVFLARACRQRRFEVIHCHDVYPTGFLAALNKLKLSVPIVITSHGGDIKEGNVRLRKPGIEARLVRALHSADALVSIGAFTTESFHRLVPTIKCIETIPNGVDLAPFDRQVDRPDSMESSIIAGEYLLFLGRLKDRKGVDVLLHALAIVPTRGGVELVIAGEGEEEANLKSQVSNLNLNGRVRMTGRTTGYSKLWLLQNALATVMPSRGWEAFPLVVLESYAAGKAMIGSDIPGLRDLIQPNVTGLLIPQESPALLAEAIARAQNDRAWLASMGQTARHVAERHAWPVIAQRHVELYESLIGSRVRSEQGNE